MELLDRLQLDKFLRARSFESVGLFPLPLLVAPLEFHTSRPTPNHGYRKRKVLQDGVERQIR
jgi:hypothetical protein